MKLYIDLSWAGDFCSFSLIFCFLDFLLLLHCISSHEGGLMGQFRAFRKCDSISWDSWILFVPQATRECRETSGLALGPKVPMDQGPKSIEPPFS
jgi:hypothetical protein